MPAWVRKSGILQPYVAPFEPVRVNAGHYFSVGLKSLWLPGNALNQGAGAALINFAPDLVGSNLTLPLAGSKPVPRIPTPFGIAAQFDGGSSSGWFRAPNSSPWNPNTSLIATSAILLTYHAAGTGAAPLAFAQADASAAATHWIAADAFEVQTAGGDSFQSFGTPNVDTYVLVAGTTRSTSDHEMWTVYLTETSTGPSFATSTTSVTTSTGVTVEETLGGTFYGSTDNVINGNLVAAWFWGRGMSHDELGAFLNNPFSNLEPLARRHTYSAVGGGTFSGSLSETAATGDSTFVTSIIDVLSETAAASDSAVAAVTVAVSLSDTAATGDSLAVASFDAALSETAAISDTAVTVITVVAALSDSAAASDAADTAMTVAALLSEGAITSDQLAVSGGGVYSASLSDTTATNDIFSALQTVAAALSDTAATSESLTGVVVGSYTASLDESAAATDALSETATMTAAILETLATAGAPNLSGGGADANFFFGGF